MIISFGWTTPALLAGQKTVTRRDWVPSYAAKFKAGMKLDAWNTSPRNVKGNPHKIATIRLTHDPYLEWSTQMPTRDAELEGFTFMLQRGLGPTVRRIMHNWSESPREFYVVRFEVVEYLEGPHS